MSTDKTPYVTVKSTLTHAISYTPEGHQIFPREWTSVPRNEVVDRLILDGTLVALDHAKLTGMSDPQAIQAAKATDVVNDSLKSDTTDTMSVASAETPAKRKATPPADKSQ